jgi:hypothetical protein
MENKYYTVKVEFQLEDEKGKIKKQKVDYLIDAISVTEVTEAEAKMTKYLVERSERNFEIKAAITSPIVDVID